MKTDPMAGADPATIPPPPLRGPGSGKDAWVAFAREVARSNELLWQAVDQQSAVIRELEAELTLQRRQLARRKPKGGRPRLSDERAAGIEAELAAGDYSRRATAVRHGVSAMTVSRLAARMAERRALTE